MARSRTAAVFRLLLYLVVVAAGGMFLFIWNDFREVRRVLAMADGQDVPPLVSGAFIAAEDPDFLQHSRFYTLQTLAKPSHPSLVKQLVRWYVDRRGLTGKAREVILSSIFEISEPKQRISRAYATNVYLGQVEGESVHGIGEAARGYFHRTPEQLSPEQAASIAATVGSPTLFYPYSNSERAVTRRLEILERMLRAGVITAAEFERAKVSREVPGAPPASGGSRR